MSTLPEENHIRILRENVEFISKETNLKSLLLEYLLQSKTITQCEFESIKQILDREGTTKAASALVTEVCIINSIKGLKTLLLEVLQRKITKTKIRVHSRIYVMTKVPLKLISSKAILILITFYGA